MLDAPRRVVDVAFLLIEKLGVPIAVLIGVLLWFMASEAGWVNTAPKQALAMGQRNNEQLALLTKAVEALTVSVNVIAAEQVRQNRSSREMLCYAFTSRDPSLYKACIEAPKL